MLSGLVAAFTKPQDMFEDELIEVQSMIDRIRRGLCMSESRMNGLLVYIIKECYYKTNKS